MSTEKSEITIAKNRRASFEFSFIANYVAGISLTGTEIKSVRLNQVNIADAYCVFVDDELYVRNMSIEPYKEGTYFNHEPKRDRKLLLKKIELKKLLVKLKDKGLTVIPTRMLITENGFAKLEIALAKGKKTYDKREDLKQKDARREMARKNID